MDKNQLLQQFIPKGEYEMIKNSAEHKEILENLYKMISEMPVNYGQDGLGDHKVVFLHYFINDSDWYITEKDMGDVANNDFSQLQAYGFAILNGDIEMAESGYIPIDTEEGLIAIEGMQLDLFFTPTTLMQIKKKHDIGTSYPKVISAEKFNKYKHIFDVATKYGFNIEKEFILPENINIQAKSEEQQKISQIDLPEDIKKVAGLLETELEPEIKKLIEFLDTEKDIRKKAAIWNEGKEDKEGNSIIASRNRIVYGTKSETLWQIGMRNPTLELNNHGKESKIFFTGKDLLIAIKKALKENGYILKDKPETEIKEEPKQDKTMKENKKEQKKIVEEAKQEAKTETREKEQDINTQFIDLGKGKSQFDNTIAIRKLIDEKGVKISNYTPAELHYIRKYEGLGGLSNKGFGEREILDQFFTPYNIIEKMWGLAYKHGFTSDVSRRICEPSAGIGRFLEYVPEKSMVDAYEIDYYSYVICKLTFPKFNVINADFESIFFSGERRLGISAVADKRYDLFIGNPPYRDFQSKYASIKDFENKTEKSETLADTFDQYFIARGVDLLKKGGLLIYVIPSTFLHNSLKYNDFKEQLSKKCELVDAYRLPVETFEHTSVGTDIIVLKKTSQF